MATPVQLEYSQKARRLLAIVREEAEVAGLRNPHITLDRGNITMAVRDHELTVATAGAGYVVINIKSAWFDVADGRTERQIREAVRASLRQIAKR